jgi:elongation factor 2
MTASMKLNSQQMQEAMYRQDNIRNISVIAHVDHGKSTLTDALASRAGLIPENQSGERRFTDIGEDEKARGITIKSTAVSMFFDVNDVIKVDSNQSDGGYLVNLIDSPGHVDFSAEVTAALRVTDGALVVVDVISGCSSQTETVLRQALSERIKPVLVINKIDRAILEQQLEPEQLYLQLRKIIDNVNYLISVYTQSNDENEEETKNESSFKCAMLDPVLGNVAFASGKDGWAFTLNSFACIYDNKRKSTSTSILNKLWGDQFFNSETKKWQTSPKSNESNLVRGFNQYILDPIYKILKVCADFEFDQLEKFCERVNFKKFKINAEKKENLIKLGGRSLMKAFMKQWLPAADALLELIVLHLPSPLEAQKYRVDNLYEGPLDDECAMAIRTCDKNGPLMIFISKMMPDPMDKRKFFAFGRVFSGTAQTGLNVRIMSPEYDPTTDNQSGLSIKNLTRCVCMIGGDILSFEHVPCGNIVALAGIDKILLKSGTISTSEIAHHIKPMKFSVSPVVRIAVEPINPADLVKFLEGLKILCRSDQLVQVKTEKGKHILCGAGELHLEICVKELEKNYAKVPIRVSDPLVTYKETVTKKSDRICLAKSANKLNRVYLTAEPLSEEFCNDIDNGRISINQDAKERVKYLQTAHNFDSTEAKKIWCFGPNQFDSNILVDVMKGVQSANDVRDTLCAGFQWGSSEGILCEESLRGVRFNLEDLSFHSDAVHRKGPQLIPTMRRAMMSALLSAEPRLLEPIYLIDIQCPENVIGPIYTLINKKRGEIIDKEPLNGTLLVNIKAYLPVNESNNFTDELRGVTGGKAFPQSSFHHWQLLPGDPFDATTKAGQVCKELRKLNNMKETMPLLAEYLDKL